MIEGRVIPLPPTERSFTFANAGSVPSLLVLLVVGGTNLFNTVLSTK